MRKPRIKWRPCELAFIKRRRKWSREQLHAALVKKFRRRDVSLDNLRQLCVRKGWTGASREELGKRMTGRSTSYSAAELTWIKRRKKTPRRKLHAEFVKTFGRDLPIEALKQLCQRKGWLTGRDGRLVKGNVPANKGKKMPFNANSARTRFKKGNRTGRANEIYKPIGTERFSKEGYLERKIHDGLPLQSRWRAVHIVNWEALNGPVPKKHCLKCLDGNKLNTAPSNWDLISRAVLVRLSGRSGNQYDRAPAELKPTVMAIAKLEHRLSQKSASQE